MTAIAAPTPPASTLNRYHMTACTLQSRHEFSEDFFADLANHEFAELRKNPNFVREVTKRGGNPDTAYVTVRPAFKQFEISLSPRVEFILPCSDIELENIHTKIYNKFKHYTNAPHPATIAAAPTPVAPAAPLPATAPIAAPPHILPGTAHPIPLKITSAHRGRFPYLLRNNHGTHVIRHQIPGSPAPNQRRDPSSSRSPSPDPRDRPGTSSQALAPQSRLTRRQIQAAQQQQDAWRQALEEKDQGIHQIRQAAQEALEKSRPDQEGLIASLRGRLSGLERQLERTAGEHARAIEELQGQLAQASRAKDTAEAQYKRALLEITTLENELIKSSERMVALEKESQKARHSLQDWHSFEMR